MKVLVIRFSSLGDVILASSILDPLFNSNIKVDFLTFKPFSELFKNDFRINKLIEVDKKELKTFSQIKNFSDILKKEKYDYIIDLHSNLRSFLISYFLGKKTIRYKKKSLKRRLFLYKPFRKFLYKENFNVIHAYLETLKFLGEKDYKKYRPKLILTEEDFKNLDKLPNNFVVIGAGARYKNKMYPYFNKVAEILLNNNLKVVLIGSKEDKNIDKNIYPKDVIDLRGKLSLRQSLAVISKAKGVISNDSAIAHMSRAVKKPILMIYGATHPFFGFAPLEDEGDYIIKNIDCQPCDLHGKKKCKYNFPKCLDIEPNLIANRFINLIEKSERGL